MGNVLKKVDLTKYSEMYQDVENHFQQLEKEKDNFEDTTSYNMVLLAKKYDDFLLDPIVGFFIPGVGDIISSVAALPALYVAMFKLRSVKLTIAILYITILDVLCGLIPFAGDIVDAFYKSNKKARRWIIGYVEGDPDTISEINKAATWGVVGLVILGFIIYLLFNVIMSIYNWFAGLF
ncbi:MAG: DUF4112 domain-containing protein [Muribaculaceae bacterium]|nr:DUF4112 domain-containing protein [Muribaculaceae bacterium]